MNTLIVFSIVVVAALAEQKITTLRDYYASVSHDKSGIRIIQGLPAQAGQIPWQVAVITRDGGGTHLCGGTLIGNQWVATAAHCAAGAISFNVYLGGISLAIVEEGSLVVSTTDYVAHPSYDYRTLNNDIALIRLPQPVSYTDRIRAIRLPQVGETVPVGSEVTVSGWGQISDQPGSISQTLNYVNLTVISNSLCASYFGSPIVINATLCAVGNPQHNTCNGDSGGPLSLVTRGEHTLHGIVSFIHGAGCTSGFPSGYVRIETVRSWIQEVTGL